jgi:adenylate kinase family enzyme
VKKPRIVLVGVSGNGKTTLARRLADELDIAHIELDALCHLPDWKEASDADFRREVAARMTSPGWVVDGSYQRKLGGLTYDHADIVVWLDLPLPVVLYRLVGRALVDIVTQRNLFNGNRQSFRMAFVEKDSLVAYAIKEHFRRRREDPAKLTALAARGIQVVRLRSPSEVERWVAALRVPGSKLGA